MEKKEPTKETTPLELITTIFLDYKNVLNRTLNDYPDDENIIKFVGVYENAVLEFKNAVTSDDIVNDDKIQSVLLAMDLVSEENRVILINSISNFMDLVSAPPVKDDDVMMKKALAIYCMLYDIYSEVDEKYTCKFLMSDIIKSSIDFAESIIDEQEKNKKENPDAFNQKSYDFGLSYRELTKVVSSIVQEEMNNAEDSVEFIFRAYEKMNSIEKDFFIEQIMNGYIDGNESEILSQQSDGMEVDKELDNKLIATRQLLWKIQKKFKAY